MAIVALGLAAADVVGPPAVKWVNSTLPFVTVLSDEIKQKLGIDLPSAQEIAPPNLWLNDLSNRPEKGSIGEPKFYTYDAEGGRIRVFGWMQFLGRKKT